MTWYWWLILAHSAIGFLLFMREIWLVPRYLKHKDPDNKYWWVTMLIAQFWLPLEIGLYLQKRSRK